MHRRYGLVGMLQHSAQPPPTADPVHNVEHADYDQSAHIRPLILPNEMITPRTKASCMVIFHEPREKVMPIRFARHHGPDVALPEPRRSSACPHEFSERRAFVVFDLDCELVLTVVDAARLVAQPTTSPEWSRWSGAFLCVAAIAFDQGSAAKDIQNLAWEMEKPAEIE